MRNYTVILTQDNVPTHKIICLGTNMNEVREHVIKQGYNCNVRRATNKDLLGYKPAILPIETILRG